MLVHVFHQTDVSFALLFVRLHKDLLLKLQCSLHMGRNQWFVQWFLVQHVSLQSGLSEFQHEPSDCACGEPMFLISFHITSFWQLYILHACHVHPLHQIDASLLMFVLCINVELGQAVWTWYIVCDLCSASLYRAFLYNQVWLSSSMNLQIVLVGNPCSLFQSILHLFGSCISCMPAHGHPSLHQIDDFKDIILSFLPIVKL